MEEEIKKIIIKEKELAQKLWEIPFASSNLDRLTKEELLLLNEVILERISFEKEEWEKLDIKDLLFEQKCWLIECLDDEFFNRMKD